MLQRGFNVYPNTTFSLTGFAEFEQQLLALRNGVRSDLTARNTLVKAAKDSMSPVYNQVIATAPYNEKNDGPIHLRDTARLDAHIPSSKDKLSDYVNPTDAVIAVVSVKKSAVSLAQEFGTRKMSAQPFLRRALFQNADVVLSSLKTELGHWIPTYAAKLAKGNKHGIK